MTSAPEPSIDALPDDWKTKLRFSEDQYQNLFSGQGTSIDKTKHTTVAPFVPVDLEDAINLYRGDFIAQNTCRMPAADATRKGFDLTIVQGDQTDKKAQKANAQIAKLIQDEYEIAGFKSSFKTALEWDGRDGGSALLIGADDGSKSDVDLGQPLQRWRKLQRLIPIERCCLSAASGSKLIEDIGSPRYGLPDKWSVQLAGATGSRKVEIDGSRLIVFTGIPMSRMGGGANFAPIDTWGGGSMLDVMKEPLRRYRAVWSAVEGAFGRFSLLVMRMAGLARLMQADDGAGVVKRRLALISMAMSTLKMVPIDADAEKLEELASSMAGCAEIIMRAQDDVAGASGLPLTKLFGHSPAGFSSDDEPGKENWQAKVSDLQQDKLVVPTNEVIKMICLGTDGPTKGKLPPRWQITFRPLSVESADTISKRRSQDATTAETYARISAVSPDEIREGLRADPHCPFPLSEDAPETDDELDPELDPEDDGTDPAVSRSGSGADGIKKPGDATVADVTLSGIQLEAMNTIVDGVARGTVERESGLARLEIAFRLSSTDALRIMGKAGAGFVPKAPEPAPAPEGQPKPDVPTKPERPADA